MDQIATALQGELRQTLDRLRDLGGAVVFEDYPGALEAGDDGEVGGDSVRGLPDVWQPDRGGPPAGDARGRGCRRPGPVTPCAPVFRMSRTGSATSSSGEAMEGERS